MDGILGNVLGANGHCAKITAKRRYAKNHFSICGKRKIYSDATLLRFKQMPLHSSEECNILGNYSNSDYWTMKGGYECLWMIRVISLRTTNPEVYKRLMEMPEDVDLAKEDVVPGIYFAIQMLRRLYGISERDFGDTELEHVWYILRTKGLKLCSSSLGRLRYCRSNTNYSVSYVSVAHGSLIHLFVILS